MDPREQSRVKTRQLLLCLLSALLVTANVPASVPALPIGAKAEWAVSGPEEIVLYLAFDPEHVQDRLPSHLRFITVEELAAGGIAWAREFLVRHPAKGSWGVSFLELVRTRTFTIAGRAPAWPSNAAVALWFARVGPSRSSPDLGPGQPLLALEFWMPDRAYVKYMKTSGYYSSYGEARLSRTRGGHWTGTLAIDGLAVEAECSPGGPVTGGPSSAGMQVIFPPATSTVTGLVRLAFAGHREQACGGVQSWTIRGPHPLAGAVVLGPPTFQFGYRLRGGAYPAL